MAPVLYGYWDVRGLGQQVRLLLEYAGVEYEEKVYKVGDAPDYDKSSWFSVKFTLGLDFPNLPYYIDEEVKLTQSNAIMRYLARKHELAGHTEEERWRIDLAENEVKDFYAKFIKFCYVDYNVEEYKESVVQPIRQFSDFLGGRTWFAGEHISYVDFLLYEALDQHLMLDKTCLKDAANLQEFHKRFEQLPAIKKFMESPRYHRTPIMNRMAKFGSK